MPLDLFTAAECAEARDQAMALHEKIPAGKAWLARARIHAKGISLRKGWVTVDDVRESFEPPPTECDGRIRGTIFKGNEWIKVGEVRSLRKTNHNKFIAKFRWVGEPMEMAA